MAAVGHRPATSGSLRRASHGVAGEQLRPDVNEPRRRRRRRQDSEKIEFMARNCYGDGGGATERDLLARSDTYEPRLRLPNNNSTTTTTSSSLETPMGFQGSPNEANFAREQHGRSAELAGLLVGMADGRERVELRWLGVAKLTTIGRRFK